MTFTFMAIHHPRPEHREDRAWQQEGDPRIVAISRWESRQAFDAAAPVMARALAGTPFDLWEEREAELFHLEQVVTPPAAPA